MSLLIVCSQNSPLKLPSPWRKPFRRFLNITPLYYETKSPAILDNHLDCFTTGAKARRLKKTFEPLKKEPAVWANSAMRLKLQIIIGDWGCFVIWTYRSSTYQQTNSFINIWKVGKNIIQKSERNISRKTLNKPKVRKERFKNEWQRREIGMIENF